MSNRTADFFLTVLGTLLVIATFVGVLVIPIYVGFGMLSAKPGDGTGLRVTLGSLGYLAGAGACAAGAWAIRRLMKRNEANARRGGFEVSRPK